MVFYPGSSAKPGAGSKYAGKPGSIMAPSVNFRPDQLMFDYEDIPVKSRDARNNLKKHLTVDRLGVNRPKWNTDTTPSSFKVCDRTPSRTLCRGQSTTPAYNFRAEVLPRTQSTLEFASTDRAKLRGEGMYGRRPESVTVSMLARPQTKEMDVNPKLKGKAAWDDRCTVDEGLITVKSDKLQSTVERRRNRAKRQPRKEGELSLYAREAEAMDTLRKEKAQAGVPKRPVPRKKDKNLIGNRREAVVAKATHSGSYAWSQIEKEKVWSCCMRPGKNSPGCNKIKGYKNAWNFAGLTS